MARLAALTAHGLNILKIIMLPDLETSDSPPLSTVAKLFCWCFVVKLQSPFLWCCIPQKAGRYNSHCCVGCTIRRLVSKVAGMEDIASQLWCQEWC